MRGIFSRRGQVLASENSRFIVNDSAFPALPFFFEASGQPVFALANPTRLT
ncbi:hypothetical protein SFMTTN_3425 [Sulfuriferula multivorans]|uniref:Uncharacterized protein n=1 Tax=Sulfuriferula multivorans TaxID=1559896 RepID=A0A401K0M5_9PROT|nr:hypothetical protein SFMTTN_3425 [Sulfuriferula multivorans]